MDSRANPRAVTAKRAFAAAATTERRWAEGRYSRRDAHKHTWSVECLELVDVPTLGRVLVSGGWDGQVFAWRRREPVDGGGAEWEPLRGYVGPGGAWVSSVAATGKRIVAGDTFGRVWVWRYESSVPARAWHHGGAVTKVCFVPGAGAGAGARAGPSRGSATVRPAAPRGTRAAPVRRPSSPFGGRPSPTARPALVFGAGGAGAIAVEAPNAASAVEAPNAASAASAASAPIASGTRARARPEPEVDAESALVASASTDADVKIWDVATGAHLATLRGHVDVVWHVRALTPSSPWDRETTVLTASRDCTLRAWIVPVGPSDAGDEDRLRLGTTGSDGPAAREIRPERVMRAHDDAVLSLAVWEERAGANGEAAGSNLGPDALAATCGADGVVVVWDPRTGAVVSTLRGHTHGVLAAEFVRWNDALRIVTGSADTSVRIFDPYAGELVASIFDHGAPVSQIRATATALVTVAPGDGVMAYARRADEDEHEQGGGSGSGGGSNSVSDGRPAAARALEATAGLRASAALMDGAGSGFSSCVAFDGEVLAVGTKTGTIQILDFRANDADTIA